MISHLALAAGLLAAPEWQYAVTMYAYDVSESQDYVNPGFTADRGMLHLEARYNYEALETASLWAGANFSAGEKWVFDATVMFGGVFGEAEGFAPGFRLALTRGWFEATSEGEYYVDLHHDEDNYFFTWNELAGYPLEWLRFGVAFQRTRVYASELEVQRGPFVGVSYKRLGVTGYVFNPGSDDATYTLGLSFEF